MQNKTIRLWTGSLAIIAACCLVIVSCKRTYDDPPVTGVPNIVANTTIKDLKAKYTTQGSVVPVTDDIVIRGVVNMDDKSGNFYQQIAIQDSTGGILLRLAGSNLNTSYPVGRELFIKVKGLYLGDYGRMIQIGGGVDTLNGGVTLLAGPLQDLHIIKGATNQPLVPKVVSISQLGTSLQDPYVNTLIQLDNMEFAAADTSKKYADLGFSGNRIIQGCSTPSSNRITLRTSDFSNFATQPIPDSNGTVIGIYSIFNATKQLTIRDTTDVRFYGPRCTGTSTGGGGGTGSGGSNAPVITLGATSPYTITFDGIGSGLPDGVKIGVTSNATKIDSGSTLIATKELWNKTAGGFKNYASAAALSQGADSASQVDATNRALGIRQTGSAGDPGASFTFVLANTTGKNNLKLDFLLQSLDPSSTRTTTWVVDYAVGDNPASLTTVAATGTLTTGGSTFSNNAISVTLPAAVNNQSQKVWVRIIASTSTTGGGNRASSAIDDVKFSWN